MKFMDSSYSSDKEDSWK